MRLLFTNRSILSNALISFASLAVRKKKKLRTLCNNLWALSPFSPLSGITFRSRIALVRRESFYVTRKGPVNLMRCLWIFAAIYFRCPEGSWLQILWLSLLLLLRLPRLSIEHRLDSCCIVVIRAWRRGFTLSCRLNLSVRLNCVYRTYWFPEVTNQHPRLGNVPAHL